MKFTAFQFVPVASCPMIGHPSEKPASTFTSIHQLFIRIDKIPRAFSPPEWTDLALLACPCVADVPIP